MCPFLGLATGAPKKPGLDRVRLIRIARQYSGPFEKKRLFFLCLWPSSDSNNNNHKNGNTIKCHKSCSETFFALGAIEIEESETRTAPGLED